MGKSRPLIASASPLVLSMRKVFPAPVSIAPVAALYPTVASSPSMERYTGFPVALVSTPLPVAGGLEDGLAAFAFAPLPIAGVLEDGLVTFAFVPLPVAGV